MEVSPSPRKIVDCFLFYNEIQMLNYRLNALYDVVDYFVIVEATHTFVGKEKKLFFKENADMFSKMREKIIHVVIDDYPYIYPNIDTDKKEQWVNEKHHRNSISRILDQMRLSPQDLIIISDVDEIPDPEVLSKMKLYSSPFEIVSLNMDMYYYNLHCYLQHTWTHPKMMSYHWYLSSSKNLNDIRLNSYTSIKCGWHLSYFGDSAFIKNKIQQFSHQELNNRDNTNINIIETRKNNGVDVFGRNIQISHIPIHRNNYLPPQFDKYLKGFYQV